MGCHGVGNPTPLPAARTEPANSITLLFVDNTRELYREISVTAIMGTNEQLKTKSIKDCRANLQFVKSKIDLSGTCPLGVVYLRGSRRKA